jgi:predicted AlkP superfamily pyrophosphatase or phosphodiesterase
MKSFVQFRALRNTFVVAALLAGAFAARAAPLPDLVVVIAIDQFRNDYLERFRRYFDARGFNLLLDHGANFVDCHHGHSVTHTGPGHAVMLTGVYANIHGIIANSWLDRATFERISCVGDPTVQILGLVPPDRTKPPSEQGGTSGCSPRNLLVTTVGDEWKLARGRRPKVIGISNKPRAAILMAGKLADAAYFMEDGRMVTSTYYMETLPAWVQKWNEAGKIDAYFGRTWERVLPEAAYACQGPDDAPGEDDGGSLGRTLPKTVTGGAAKPGRAFYSAFGTTPFSSEVLVDFAQAAVENERLGRRGVTDILCVSFSANDAIGHAYGPDSHEVMDTVVRTDRLLAQFLAFLDAQVGLEHCTIVLTEDHGVSPMPEWINASGSSVASGRLDADKILNDCEGATVQAFGALPGGGRWLAADASWLLIHPEALRQSGRTRAEVENVVRDALLRMDFVQAVYTRTRLETGDFDDELGRRAWRSFNKARSGDVFYQTKPYYFSRAVGSNHGSPYNYDTHVPLLWYGVGVKPGVYAERVGVVDLAPTLSRILGLPAPPFAEGRVLF